MYAGICNFCWILEERLWLDCGKTWIFNKVTFSFDSQETLTPNFKFKNNDTAFLEAHYQPLAVRLRLDFDSTKSIQWFSVKLISCNLLFCKIYKFTCYTYSFKCFKNLWFHFEIQDVLYQYSNLVHFRKAPNTSIT